MDELKKLILDYFKSFEDALGEVENKVESNIDNSNTSTKTNVTDETTKSVGLEGDFTGDINYPDNIWSTPDCPSWTVTTSNFVYSPKIKIIRFSRSTLLYYIENQEINYLFLEDQEDELKFKSTSDLGELIKIIAKR